MRVNGSPVTPDIREHLMAAAATASRGRCFTGACSEPPTLLSYAPGRRPLRPVLCGAAQPCRCRLIDHREGTAGSLQLAD